ncbi:hypothetical protein C5F61_00025 [Photobacterium damselae subsp. damselae]|uniref:hypothetical protein n=1 Tax=Photobacterium damselae TaxID=38293 RepID=UPI000D07F968|nr:hypothetical protein [Photobacterium damselae]PSB82777.1 hypothetical protein C5F61_00025 [Photobacterium damselae subsp. damselae]
MADSTATANTLVNTSAAIAIATGVSESNFAQSLLSASFDQIIHGHFYWQLSDVITLVCSAIVVWNFVAGRIEKRKLKKLEEANA